MAPQESVQSLPLFDTFPKNVAVLRLESLQEDPTYSGLMEFLSQDVSREQLQDMGGRGWIRERIFGGENEPQYSCHDIEHLVPFSNHFHRRSWEVILLEDGEANLNLGGKVVENKLSETETAYTLEGNFDQQIHMKKGDLVIVPPGTPQSIEILTKSIKTKVLMSPPFNREKDSFKFSKK